MKILVTGGTGFIGKHVVAKLLELGDHEVIVLTRRAVAGHNGVFYLKGDLSDKLLVTEAIREVDYVVHLAGCKKDSDAFLTTNVVGTENIVSACSNYHVRKLLYLSSVGVIGPTKCTEINELTSCRPSNGYEKSKYQAELLVRQFSQSNPGKAIILRPTNVFGEDDPEMHLLNLITKLQRQRFYYVGDDTSKYYVNYLYVKEISELIPYMLAHNANSDLYILNTPSPLTEFITTIKQILSNDTPVKRLPYLPLKLAAACFDLVPKSIVNPPPINSLKLSELTNKKQYSSALIAKELNWSPVFSMSESLHNMIIHYYEKGLVK